MSDEKVEKGETVLTSGGDRVFPKGLLIGTVKDVFPGPELFLNIRVTPAARISRLEEVLVITKVEEKQAEPSQSAGPIRAADVLAQRLPTVAKPEATAPAGSSPSSPDSPQQKTQAANPGSTAPPTVAEFLRPQEEKDKAAAKTPSPGNGAVHA